MERYHLFAGFFKFNLYLLACSNIFDITFTNIIVFEVLKFKKEKTNYDLIVLNLPIGIFLANNRKFCPKKIENWHISVGSGLKESLAFQ